MHSSYAFLLQSMGDTKGAAKHYGEALGINPEDADTHSSYAFLLSAWATLRELRSTTRRPSGSSRGCRCARQLRQPAERMSDTEGAAKHSRRPSGSIQSMPRRTTTTPSC